MRRVRHRCSSEFSSSQKLLPIIPRVFFSGHLLRVDSFPFSHSHVLKLGKWREEMKGLTIGTDDERGRLPRKTTSLFVVSLDP